MTKGKDKRKPDAKKRPKDKDEPRGMFEPPKGKRKKVPVISISVGMAEFPKGKSKPHNYFAGGSVKMNPGLRALKKASPEAFNKITKS